MKFTHHERKSRTGATPAAVASVTNIPLFIATSSVMKTQTTQLSDSANSVSAFFVAVSPTKDQHIFVLLHQHGRC